eukprot:1737710-Amphidinium_carterae.1
METLQLQYFFVGGIANAIISVATQRQVKCIHVDVWHSEILLQRSSVRKSATSVDGAEVCPSVAVCARARQRGADDQGLPLAAGASGC